MANAILAKLGGLREWMTGEDQRSTDYAAALGPEDANRAFKMKSDLKRGFMGRTDNAEACRCLPGTIVEAPSAAQRMAKTLEGALGSQAAHRREFAHEAKRAEQLLLPALKNLDREQHAFDASLAALRLEAGSLESLAGRLAAARRALSEAYGESNCETVATDARSHGEQEPDCVGQFKEASVLMRRIGAEARQTCEVGAASLQRLQHLQASPFLLLTAPMSPSSVARTPGPGRRAEKRRRADGQRGAEAFL